MYILASHNNLILPPRSRWEWREPSQRWCGIHDIENRTWFKVEARTSDGLLYWRGWFEDRDDADKFLWAIATESIRYDHEIRRLPVGPSWPHTSVISHWYPARYEGEWYREWIDLPLSYHFDTVTFITSSPGSTQSISAPGDWNNSANLIEGIGGGGSGGSQRTTSATHCTGGGGGAYQPLTNFTWSGSITVQVGSGGPGVQGAPSLAGNSGTKTWWNSTVSPTPGTSTTILGADFGVGGKSASGNQSGGTGGLTTNGTGDASGKAAGGQGGNLTGSSGSGGSGGGGAGGKVGAGTAGTSSSSTSAVATAGGNGDAGSGSLGTAGSTIANSSQPTPVTEWTDSLSNTACAGGGSGGIRVASTASLHSGTGGLYGGGSGGAVNSSNSGAAVSGDAGQGILIYTYTPSAPFLAKNIIFV